MKLKITLLMFLFILTSFLTVHTENAAAADRNTPIQTVSPPVQNGDNAEQNGENAVRNNEKAPLQEVTYLWNEGTMPAVTEYPENSSRYSDPPDFRPNMVYYPAKEGTTVKGAVLICAGGAFQVRAESDEAPVAERLNELGYHCFVVKYRLRPYTQEEAALDLARAVRYVRSYAEDLGMDEKDIAVIGFSAGGILCGEMLLNYDGLVDGTSIDESYVPDELDKISADAGAVSMIYSFYGRLSVASSDVEKFKESNLPPAYFLYGSEEIFRSQIEACADAVEQAGVLVERKVLEGYQHGFGARGDWFADFDRWLSQTFSGSSGSSSGNGTVDMTKTIASKILGGTQNYTVYLPPSYNSSPDKEYPVLYLLHGLWQDYTSWETNGNLKFIADNAIADGISVEMIIVSPNAYGTFYVNGYDNGMKYEDYFIQEFIPSVESAYRIKAGKDGRAIAGLSMGGYGCAYYAFKYPEMFSSAFAMSSAFTVTDRPQIGPLVTERTEAELLEFPAFVMECGTQDFGAYPMNNALNEILSETSLEYTYTTRPGVHDWAFWQECLPKALSLASSNFKYD
jgi:enterochelin esterase-like enzyme/acetyl esterase/lipase